MDGQFAKIQFFATLFQRDKYNIIAKVKDEDVQIQTEFLRDSQKQKMRYYKNH